MTVLAASSVVTTAVYLLRALTRCSTAAQDPHTPNSPTRLSSRGLAILVFFLAFAGMFPGWMINSSPPRSRRSSRGSGRGDGDGG
jgi:NADH:ubiquinone oxidoreductase subunit 4 (subunit M)